MAAEHSRANRYFRRWTMDTQPLPIPPTKHSFEEGLLRGISMSEQLRQEKIEIEKRKGKNNE